MHKLILAIAGIVFIPALVSCTGNKDRVYFDGPIVIVDMPEQTESLRGIELSMDGLFTGEMAVYDTLIFFCSLKYSDYFVSVFNLNDYSHIRNFCMKGRGPDEFSALTSIYQFYWEKGELKTILYDVNRKNLVICNISKVVTGDIDYIERNIPYVVDDNISLNMVFRLDEERSLARTFVRQQDLSSDVPPTYLVRKFREDKEDDMFGFFKRHIVEGLGAAFGVTAGFQYISMDNIQPSGDKLAAAMTMLAQINIVDIRTKEKKGIRVQGTPNFDYLTVSTNTAVFYYTSAAVSDDFIYALWCNKVFDPTQGLVSTSGNIIHVFDWEGNFVKILNLNQTVDQIVVDEVTRTLYAKSNTDDIVFCYGKVE